MAADDEGDVATALADTAVARFKEKDYKGAEKLLDLITKMRHHNEDTVVALIHTFAMSKRLQEAIDISEAFIAQNLPCIKVRYTLGQLYASLGALDISIEHFQAIVAVNPSYESVLVKLAGLLSANGDFQQALAVLEQARGLQPDNADIHYNLALLAAQQRQDSDAHFQKSLELRFQQEVLLMWMRARADRKKLTDPWITECVDRYSRADPEGDDAVEGASKPAGEAAPVNLSLPLRSELCLAVSDLLAKDIKPADLPGSVRWLERAITAAGFSVSMGKRLGEAYLAAGMFDKAVLLFQDLLSQVSITSASEPTAASSSSDAPAVTGSEDSSDNWGKFSAWDSPTAAGSGATSSADTRADEPIGRVGRDDWTAEDEAEAAKLRAEAAPAAPAEETISAVEACAYLMYALARQGQLETAARISREWEKDNPNNDALLDRYANLLMDGEHFEEAADLMRKMLETDATNYRLRIQLAMALGSAGFGEDALQELTTAAEHAQARNDRVSVQRIKDVAEYLVTGDGTEDEADEE